MNYDITIYVICTLCSIILCIYIYICIYYVYIHIYIYIYIHIHTAQTCRHRAPTDDVSPPAVLRITQREPLIQGKVQIHSVRSGNKT